MTIQFTPDSAQQPRPILRDAHSALASHGTAVAAPKPATLRPVDGGDASFSQFVLSPGGVSFTADRVQNALDALRAAVGPERPGLLPGEMREVREMGGDLARSAAWVQNIGRGYAVLDRATSDDPGKELAKLGAAEAAGWGSSTLLEARVAAAGTTGARLGTWAKGTLAGVAIGAAVENMVDGGVEAARRGWDDGASLNDKLVANGRASTQEWLADMRDAGPVGKVTSTFGHVYKTIGADLTALGTSVGSWLFGSR